MEHDFQKQLAAFFFFLVGASAIQNQKQCPEFSKPAQPGLKIYEVMAQKTSCDPLLQPLWSTENLKPNFFPRR